VLRTEQAAFTLMAARTRPAWEQSCRDAETWLLRAALLAGQEGVRPPSGLPAAQIRVTWTSALGTTYPAHGAAVVPEPDPATTTVASSALVEATAAFRAALEAAVQHAVADAAARAIDAEVTATRQRLRGIQDRWIPLLDGALTRLRLDLDEAEHAEAIRLRWAGEQTTGIEQGARA
jgi:V/A-type H+-transporting ATPase subunit D